MIVLFVASILFLSKKETDPFHYISGQTTTAKTSTN
jgi:hypothetical protein